MIEDLPYPEFLPSTLGRMTMGKRFLFPAHLRAVEAACLTLITDDDVNRLVIELPVRHGKTWYCSHVLLAWFMLNYPDRSAILATYSGDFSCELLVKVRDTVNAYGPRLTGVTTGSINRQDHFSLAHPWTGHARAGSPNSGIAGKGAHLIVADDLVKNVEEVASPARRQKLATWFKSELETRLEPKGKMLLVMSRRHPDDQSGRCQSLNEELEPHLRWHVLRLPAIAEDGDPLERVPGEALWPGRYDAERLLEIKRGFELDGQSYLWDCLYQQDARGDSSLVEWPEWYFKGVVAPEIPPLGDALRWRVLGLDPSKGKESRKGDYSAWTDAQIDRQATMWIKPTLAIIPTEQVEDMTVAMILRDRYDAFVCECNGFQEVIADNIARKCLAAGVHCPLYKKVSKENKEVRIRLGVGPLLEQKRVRLDGRAPSTRIALAQLKEFPTGSHDDFPDSLNLTADMVEHLMREAIKGNKRK